METQPTPWIKALRGSHDALRTLVEPLTADEIAQPSYACGMVNRPGPLAPRLSGQDLRPLLVGRLERGGPTRTRRLSAHLGCMECSKPSSTGQRLPKSQRDIGRALRIPHSPAARRFALETVWDGAGRHGVGQDAPQRARRAHLGRRGRIAPAAPLSMPTPPHC